MYKDERKLCKSSVVKKWRCTTKIDLDYRKHMAAWYLAPPPFFSGGGRLKEPRNVCQYSNLLSNQLVLFKLAIMRCLNIRQSSERHTRLKYAFCWQRYWNVENDFFHQYFLSFWDRVSKIQICPICTSNTWLTKIL